MRDPGVGSGGRGHPAAFRLAAAGARVRAGEGGELQLHLGAGSESENVELPLSGVGPADTGSGGGGAALSRHLQGFPVPAELSQLVPGARRRRVCSRRGAEVQFPSRRPFPPQMVPCGNEGRAGPCLGRVDPWNVSSGPSIHGRLCAAAAKCGAWG